MPDSFSLGRFACNGSDDFVGVATGHHVVELERLLPQVAGANSLIPVFDAWADIVEAISDALARPEALAAAKPMNDVRALAPVPDARQIFCTGANYGRHVIEMVVALGAGADTDGMSEDERRRFGEAWVDRQRNEANPYIFMKPITAIMGPSGTLALPRFSDQIDWELELAVVIGSPAYRVDEAQAMLHVAGYMIANDVTSRDHVKRADPGAFGPDWIAAKGSPGFLPTGPLLRPAAFVADPQNLQMRLAVNGVEMQNDNTSDMTFSIARQIAFLSQFTRLLPGDILCTGSPAGNGVCRGIFLKDGDLMEAEIEGLGVQTIRCALETV